MNLTINLKWKRNKPNGYYCDVKLFRLGVRRYRKMWGYEIDYGYAVIEKWGFRTAKRAREMCEDKVREILSKGA